MREKARRTGRDKKGQGVQPQVGIFWLVDGKTILDATPLSAAEAHLQFRIYPGDHISVWERLQRQGLAPIDMEYEEPPRGRVVYNTNEKRFTLLADKCILSSKAVVREIVSAMNLPADTLTGTDSHYRCFRCLWGSQIDDDDDEE